MVHQNKRLQMDKRTAPYPSSLPLEKLGKKHSKLRNKIKTQQQNKDSAKLNQSNKCYFTSFNQS